MDSVGYTWISHGGWVPSKFQRKSVHPVAIVVTCDYQKIETKSRKWVEYGAGRDPYKITHTYRYMLFAIYTYTCDFYVYIHM